tara:strand:+ start:73 stop:456 length:384 start_codon:yes stop_codon:yes gene_type:complete
MFQRRPKRFRRRSHDRGGFSHGSNMAMKPRPHSFSNGHSRNKFRPTLSAEKLFEKYSNLAKEAMSSGDKTLSENYLQHADHFARIIDDRNKNQIQQKVNPIHKLSDDDKNSSSKSEADQDPAAVNKK